MSLSRWAGLGLVAAALAAQLACKSSTKETEGADTGSLNDENTDFASLNHAETVLLMFQEFERSEDYLKQLVVAWEREFDALDINLDGAQTNRAVRIPTPIGANQRKDIPKPASADPADQLNWVVFQRSTADFAGNVVAAVEPNQVCIESDSTVFYRRTYTNTEDCTPTAFEAGDCDTLRSVNEVKKDLSGVAEGWYDLKKDLRRFTLDDGRNVLLVRSWAECTYYNTGAIDAEFGQTYTVELYVEDEGGETTTRMYSLWSQLDLVVSGEVFEDLVRASLFQGIDRADNFATGGDCAPGDDTPRDLPYTRTEETADADPPDCPMGVQVPFPTE